MTASPEICLIIAHDAGGAEVLSSYVRRTGLRCLYVLQGPARKIFERKLGNIETLPLDEAIRQADWVLCGTSWQSELEFDAIKLARALGKRSVAFLDHWVNYRERFERKGELNLPDEIWVGDPIAAELAGKIFDLTPIRLVENPYFMDIREEVLTAPVVRFWQRQEARRAIRMRASAGTRAAPARRRALLGLCGRRRATLFPRQRVGTR